MAGLLDFIQGASNAAASNVSAPVDGIAWLLRKAGVPIPDAPVGGSDWMAQKGLTKPANGMAGLLGETAGGLAPILAAAKAPQIAQGLLKAGDNLAAPRTLNPQTGAIVWHGSPHKFSKFDSSKIGTGEGAQAYGHGLYLAESPDVAGQYKSALQNSALSIDGVPIKNQSGGSLDAADLENFIGKNANLSSLGTAYTSMAVRNHPTKEAAIDALTERVLRAPDDATAKQLQAGIDYLQRAKLDYGGSGQMYKVDLPDEHIAKMLDWDKPLSQQPKEVQAAFEPYFEKSWGGVPTPDQKLGIYVQDKLLGNGYAPYFSQDMQQAGIPGIRYLDGGSRGTGQGTSNFVVFPGNENLLQILERNGKPLNGLLD